MMRFKKYVSVLLILALVMSAFSACGKEDAAAAETVGAEIQETVPAETQAAADQAVSEGYYQIGDKIDDFTITTYDGREVSLYKVLEEKDMVLLNLWATWCGPCGSEFPAMQQAYAQYQDKVEIIALSVHQPDTDEVLAEYAQEKGMTFCVTRDTVGLESRVRHSGIPTSVVVDRFGTICLIEVGAMPDPAVFTNLFDVYTAEDYTESVFMPSMLSEMPTAQPADPAQLNDALNAEGAALTFADSDAVFYWPMTVEQKDGRTVAAASNAASAHSKSVVQTQVDAKAGDVLVVEYKLENEAFASHMLVEVNGKSVKKSTMTRDWGTYAYRFEEAGSYEIGVCFEIGWMGAAEGDGLWIDSIRVVSGDEAQKAMEANPKFPVGESIRAELVNENVTKAYVYDETDPSVTEPIYFCPDPTLQLMVTLDGSVDPENTYLEEGMTYEMYALASCATEEGFLVEIPNNDAEGSFTSLTLLCDDEVLGGMSIFASEERAQQYFDLLRKDYGMSILWEYWDDSMSETEVSGDVTYTVTYLDQNGDPVPGVMCQVCDESMCQVFTSDADGVCRFTLPAKSYEIHTLMVPNGYEGDTTTITNAPVQGGELTFTLTKK